MVRDVQRREPAQGLLSAGRSYMQIPVIVGVIIVQRKNRVVPFMNIRSGPEEFSSNCREA